MMHGREKSDSSIVVKTSGNKPAQAGADLAERREEAKGNAQRLNMRRTQSRESVSQQLERVRKVARQRKKERFTALLHHVDFDLLFTAYFWLKRNVAAGVDGVTWADYEDSLEERLNRKTEVQREIGRKGLRQQEDGIRRSGQTSPARDRRLVVG